MDYIDTRDLIHSTLDSNKKKLLKRNSSISIQLLWKQLKYLFQRLLVSLVVILRLNVYNNYKQK